MRGRRLLGAVLVVVAAATVSACQRPLAGATPQWTYQSINLDGIDQYLFEDQGRGLLARAPTTNTSDNLRYALVRKGEPASRDQQACITWNGPEQRLVQPGIVLRSSFTPAGTRTIMVTGNILYGARYGLNVHVVEPNGGDGVVTLVTSRSLASALGDIRHLRPLPWRYCARVVGNQLTTKVWALNEVAEPAWGDPTHGYTVTVPASFVVSGRPGIFVGHLAAGEEARIPDLTTWNLDGA